jgi:hypothetical protein
VSIGANDKNNARIPSAGGRSATWPRSAPTLQRRWWWWWWCRRWHSASRRRAFQRRCRDRSLRKRRLLRSVYPASSDAVLLIADRTNMAFRARLNFLRMRERAENRYDDNDCQAYDRHSFPPAPPSIVRTAMRSNTRRADKLRTQKAGERSIRIVRGANCSPIQVFRPALRISHPLLMRTGRATSVRTPSGDTAGRHARPSNNSRLMTRIGARMPDARSSKLPSQVIDPAGVF